jgi:tRNA A-37 threonylcarbamoyl transferase component Bud32
MDTGKTAYVANLKKYHEQLAQVLMTYYDITPMYMEVLSWGYNTTAFYIKSAGGEFSMRIVDFSEPRQEALIKDIAVSRKLGLYLPTAEYIESKAQKFLTAFTDIENEKKLMRVAKFITGVQPFDMTTDILNQAIAYLKRMHDVQVSDELKPELGRIENPKKQYVLLHGDLTPSNLLVSFGKVVAILDFERAALGPIEYDLARTTVFCWFRMATESFRQVFDNVADSYGNVNKDLMFRYSLDHAKEHLDNVTQAKARYTEESLWQKDLTFAQKMYQQVRL